MDGGQGNRQVTWGPYTAQAAWASQVFALPPQAQALPGAQPTSQALAPLEAQPTWTPQALANPEPAAPWSAVCGPFPKVVGGQISEQNLRQPAPGDFLRVIATTGELGIFNLIMACPPVAGQQVVHVLRYAYSYQTPAVTPYAFLPGWQPPASLPDTRQ